MIYFIIALVLSIFILIRYLIVYKYLVELEFQVHILRPEYYFKYGKIIKQEYIDKFEKSITSMRKAFFQLRYWKKDDFVSTETLLYIKKKEKLYSYMFE